jgi:sigma-B regulation protein RsbQ
MVTSETDPRTRNNVHVLGAGPNAIVMAHGFGSNQTAFRYQAAELSKSHRVVLFDHVGASATTLAAYSPRRYRGLHAYADDLLELLDDLELSQVFYVGHSMSAMVGILASQLAPERFSRMVFLEASPRYLNDANYRGGFDKSDIDGLIAAMTDHFQEWASGYAGMVMGNSDRPELADEFARSLSAIRPDIAVLVGRMIYESDHRADLPRCTTPTLIVQSSHDVAVPREVGHYLASHMPNAKLQVIAADGHFPHLSAPELVLEAIRSFLPETTA